MRQGSSQDCGMALLDCCVAVYQNENPLCIHWIIAELATLLGCYAGTAGGPDWGWALYLISNLQAIFQTLVDHLP